MLGMVDVCRGWGEESHYKLRKALRCGQLTENDKMFGFRTYLNFHKKHYHSNSCEFQCKYCNMVFQNKGAFNDHMQDLHKKISGTLLIGEFYIT